MTHIPPCAATLHLMFRRLDGVGFEAHLGAWAESVVASTPGGPARPQAAEPAVALEGKTLRGSRKQGAPGGHGGLPWRTRWALHWPNRPWRIRRTRSRPSETVLGQMVLKGRVVTMEALLTQTAVAETIVDAGGDDVMIVKANQPQRRSAIELSFAEPPVGDPQETAETLDLGHGRMEPRRFTTSQALAGYSTWPGLAQVCALERSVITKNTGKVRAETVYGVPSLTSRRGRAITCT